ncbi:MAG TPA: protein kinase [Polyangiaceae bacterium]|nr:protein kinase [Polyangiaceae bacterium]
MSAPVRAGDVVAGKYRVDEVLGKGSMGVVVAATHLRLRLRVAIKLMRSDVPLRPDWVVRFGREARAVAQIKSEHVARVLDVGELEGGAPFIVMEHLEGHDLASALAKRGPLPVAEAVGYVLEACEALAEAHQHGIVHRDLKPAHLFLAAVPGRAPVVKVLDFGISKDTGNEDAVRLTASAALIGSPLYMPPEQLRSSHDVDARSDIWSLGVVLYELLAGRTPFQGQNLATLAIEVLTKPPPPIGRADVPPGLEAAIGRCLRRERGERFDDVAELAAALAPFGPAGGRASAESASWVLHGSARPPSEPPPPSSTQPLALPPAPEALTLQAPAPTDLAPYAPAPHVLTPQATAALTPQATGSLTPQATAAPSALAPSAPAPMGFEATAPMGLEPPAPASARGRSGERARLVVFVIVLAALAIIAGMLGGLVARQRGLVGPSSRTRAGADVALAGR